MRKVVGNYCGNCCGKTCGKKLWGICFEKCTGIYLQKVVLKSCGETYDVLDRENIQENLQENVWEKSHSYLGQKSVRKKCTELSYKILQGKGWDVMGKYCRDDIQVGHTFKAIGKKDVRVIKILNDDYCLVQFESGFKQVMLRINCRNGYNVLNGDTRIISQWQVKMNRQFGINN